MNTANDYQKWKGEVISYPKGAIIEPKRKYLEVTHLIHHQIFVFIVNNWNEKKIKKFKKKTPINGVFYGFT